MTWYYAIGSERKGPVTEAELDRLAALFVVGTIAGFSTRR